MHRITQQPYSRMTMFGHSVGFGLFSPATRRTHGCPSMEDVKIRTLHQANNLVTAISVRNNNGQVSHRNHMKHTIPLTSWRTG